MGDGFWQVFLSFWPSTFWGVADSLLERGGAAQGIGSFIALPGLYLRDVRSAAPVRRTNMSPDMAKGPTWDQIIPS